MHASAVRQHECAAVVDPRYLIVPLAQNFRRLVARSRKRPDAPRDERHRAEQENRRQMGTATAEHEQWLRARRTDSFQFWLKSNCFTSRPNGLWAYFLR